jgi:cytoskeletal protein RodZ
MIQKEQRIEPQGNDSELSEPLFEEEWTVLSARQVVPLAELEANAKRHYSLKLFGAFVLASSLGVLVALASIRLRESNTRVADSVSTPETVASAQTSDNVSTPENEETEETNEDSSIPSEIDATNENSTVVRSKPARVSPSKHQNLNVDFDDKATGDAPTESSIDSKPEPRLVDQWQEGRPRRVQSRRPRNDDGAHHSRDLRDFDEIFEGSRKKP